MLDAGAQGTAFARTLPGVCRVGSANDPDHRLPDWHKLCFVA